MKACGHVASIEWELLRNNPYFMVANSVPSIQWRLIQLVSVCVIPIMLVALGLFGYDYWLERQALTRKAIDTATNTALLIDKEFAGIEGVLHALGGSASLKAGNITRFYTEARSVAFFGGASTIILSDLNGVELFNTSESGPQPGNKPTEWAGFISDRDSYLLSNIFTDPFITEPVVALTVPVEIMGRRMYYLSAYVRAQHFALLSKQQNLPDSWVLSVLNQDRRVVSRSRSMPEHIGKRPTQSLLNALTTARQGVFSGTTLDGSPVLGVFSIAPASGWTIAIGIPEEELTEALHAKLLILGVALATIVGSAAFIAWSIGGKIARSVQGLTKPALALGTRGHIDIPDFYFKEAGEVGEALLKASDMLRQAEYSASHDKLTGLANRALFDELMIQQITVARRKCELFSVLYIDLDGFKPVNDRLGHAAGDTVLCEVADRLRSNLRESDVAARLGGDEFAVLLIDTAVDDAIAVAEKLLQALQRPHRLSGVDTTVFASIGIATFPDSGVDRSQLIEAADKAMYRAKATGKDRIAVATS